MLRLASLTSTEDWKGMDVIDVSLKPLILEFVGSSKSTKRVELLGT